MAGVALHDMDRHLASQAWHLWHLAGSGGALGFRRGAGDAAAVGVAGVALCDIYLHFVWQAWHFVTWIVTLRGRRGTYGTGLALVARLVLGVALNFWHADCRFPPLDLIALTPSPSQARVLSNLRDLFKAFGSSSAEFSVEWPKIYVACVAVGRPVRLCDMGWTCWSFI